MLAHIHVILSHANIPAMIFRRRCLTVINLQRRTCSSSVQRGSDGQPARRGVPLTDEEFQSQKSLAVVQPADPRLLRVAVIGEPNAGKSTLVNKLLGWRVCSVSAKVHTTRENAAAVLVDGDKQVVFLDTPGVVSLQQGKKHKLEASLITHPKESFDLADLVLVLVDASNRWTRHRLSEHILDLLKKYSSSTRSILVLNKIDSLRSKHRLLDLSRILTCNTLAGGGVAAQERLVPKPAKTLEEMFLHTERAMAKGQMHKKQVKHEAVGLYSERAVVEGERVEERGWETEKAVAEGQNIEKQDEQEVQSWETEKAKAEGQNMEKREARGWPNFQKIFMVSALEGQGVNDLRRYLLHSCQPGDWLYHASVVTDQNPRDMALMVVREKVLDALPDEMPYTTGFSLQMWEVDSEIGSIKMAVDVVCQKKNALVRLLGPQGKTVAAIAEAARQELANTFHCDVMLKLLVRSPTLKGGDQKK